MEQKRRFFLTMAVALGSLCVLGSCGFELRKAPEFHFKTLCVFGSSDALSYLYKALAQESDVELINEPADADVFLEIISDKRDDIAVVQTPTGLVREIQMRGTLLFRLWVRGEDPLGKTVELEENREYSYTETQALAKEEEQRLLNLDISKSFAMQLLWRLAALRPISAP